MPLQCRYIDKLILRSEQDEIKASAIVMGIAIAYPDETFEIWLASEKQFFVKLSQSGWKNIKLDNYILNGNVLTFQINT